MVMKMYRYTEADRAIISEAWKANKNKRAEKWLQAMELRASGMSSSEVAEATGFNAAYITQLTRKYREGGREAISGNHYGGNRKNMTHEEEAALLEPFLEKAQKGQIVEVSAIKAAYEEKAGHTIGGSQMVVSSIHLVQQNSYVSRMTLSRSCPLYLPGITGSPVSSTSPNPRLQCL